jgi:flap endonuclease-1
MGITNLGPLIKKLAPDTVDEVALKDLEDQVLAVDTSIVVYQFLVALKNTNQDLHTRDGRVTSHIHAIITKALSLVKKRIRPIFVFDGQAPDLKGDTLLERRVLKEAAEKKLDAEAELDDEERVRLQKKTVRLTKEQMAECRDVLRLMGMPVIEAPGEADPQCAYLVREEIADGVISEDMDLLAFGCKRLVRGTTRDRANVYNLDRLLDKLDISYHQFIEMCILMGSDYCPTIEGIGMKRAYDLIKQHGSIEALLANEPKIKKGVYVVPDKFPYKETKAYFLNPPITKVAAKDVAWCAPDAKGLRQLLTQQFDYQDATVETILQTLKDGYYSVICNQTSKTEFLSKKRNDAYMFV